MPALWRALGVIIPRRYHEGVYDVVLQEIYKNYLAAAVRRKPAAVRRKRLSWCPFQVVYCVRAWIATLDVLRVIAVDRLIHGPSDIPDEAKHLEPDAKTRLAPHG
jgi:hypothetical protein